MPQAWPASQESLVAVLTVRRRAWMLLLLRAYPLIIFTTVFGSRAKEASSCGCEQKHQLARSCKRTVKSLKCFNFIALLAFGCIVGAVLSEPSSSSSLFLLHSLHLSCICSFYSLLLVEKDTSRYTFSRPRLQRSVFHNIKPVIV